jgi:heme exporter protein C
MIARIFLPALLLLTMCAALYAVFLYVPTEREMGVVQRIFYFHVPSAITAFIAFFLVFVGSVQYLRTRAERWDRLARCAAELGVLFSLIVLVTGPLWARPIWGVYWRWEPRLTSMLILFTIYVSYLMVRTYGPPTPQTQRFGAVLGILGFVNVPLVYYSVQLWAPDQQLHPREVELQPEMQLALYVSFGAIFLLFYYLLARRLRLERVADELAAMRRQRTTSAEDFHAISAGI